MGRRSIVPQLRVAALRERGQPRIHGSGAESEDAIPGASGTSRRDRSRRELRPNPIGSSTSCRKLVPALLGVISAGPATHREGSNRYPVMEDAFASSPRAAPRASPRRETRSAAPEVLSVDGGALFELVAFSTSCPQPVEEWTCAFCDLRADPRPSTCKAIGEGGDSVAF